MRDSDILKIEDRVTRIEAALARVAAYPWAEWSVREAIAAGMGWKIDRDNKTVILPSFSKTARLEDPRDRPKRKGLRKVPVQQLRIKYDVEADGRIIAEAVGLPGVMVYGRTADEAIMKVQALALRVLADLIEEPGQTPHFLEIVFSSSDEDVTKMWGPTTVEEP